MNDNPRGCYCDVWAKDPAHLESRGIPRGFCGICERCKQPGHLRHAPGAMPYTGAWCDRCYRIVGVLRYARWAAFMAILIAAIVAARWFFASR